MREFKTLLLDPLFDAKQCYIQYVYLPSLTKASNHLYSCMEHSVDLSAKTFVQAVSPSSARAIVKKMKKAIEVSNDGSGTLDLDELDAHLAGFDDNDDEENEGDHGEAEDVLEAEVDAADSIGKALLLVKQVDL